MAVIISRRSSYCPNFATAPEALKIANPQNNELHIFLSSILARGNHPQISASFPSRLNYSLKHGYGVGHVLVPVVACH